MASLCAAVAVLASVAALVSLAGHPKAVDSLIFVASFAALLPLCVLSTMFLAGSPRAARGLRIVTVLLPLSVISLLLLARLAGHFRPAGNAGAALIAGGGVAVLLIAALFIWKPWPPLERIASSVLSWPQWTLAAIGTVLLWTSLLVFSPVSKLTIPDITLALLISAAVASAYVRFRPTHPSGGLLLVADLLVVLLIIGVALDLSTYQTATNPNFGFEDAASIGLTTRQYQQDFYLAAANDVLHGRAMLVDTSSQYGVGSIYLLAGFFKVAPIGYGPFGLIATLFTGIELALGFAIMRIVGSRWLLATATMVAAVAIGAMTSSTAYLPSQGGLRFVFPLALLFFALGGLRRAPNPTPITAGALATLVASCLWSIETFIFTAAVLLAVMAFDIAVRSPSLRAAWRSIARGSALAGALCVASVVLLSILTRLIAGSWPDWSWYIAYVSAYSGGPARVPIGPWSPVWVLGAIYFTSLGGAISLALLRRSFAQQHLARLTALVGSSVAGLTFLVYFVNRSVDSLLVLFALPAFVVAGIWFDLTLDARRPRILRGIAVAAASWVAAFVVVAGWPSITGSFPNSAVGHLIPGGRSFSSDLTTIWHSPAIDPRSIEAQRLIDKYFDNRGDALLFIEPNLASETLMRSRRANQLPISFPAGHGIAPSSWLSRLEEGVENLPARTPLLLQRHPPDPDGNPPLPVGPLVAEQTFGQVNPNHWLSPPAETALRMVKRRFAIEQIVEGRYGLVVARLERKRAAQPASRLLLGR